MDLEITELLKQVYYDPKTGLQGSKLYQRAKALNSKVTHQKVKDFLSEQSTAQIFKRRTVKHHYPLIATYPFQRIQIDLLSWENENIIANKRFKWLFSAIDVYTRYAFSYPIKDKTESSCVEALEKLLKDVEEVYPNARIDQFDSDNEPSFLSSSFKKICIDNGIKQNLLPVTEQHATGIIERFNRTTREWINKYKVAYNTANWVDVIPDFIHNYNNSVHSTIKTTPALAVSNPERSQMDSYITNQTLKANGQHFNKHEFEVGTKVRLKIKRSLFEKRTQEQFTKTIHTIIEFKNGKFYVNDRVNGYAKAELLKVDKSIDRAIISQEEKDELENEIQTRQIDRRVQRRVNREGVERNEQALRRSARERRPNQLEDVLYGKIRY